MEPEPRVFAETARQRRERLAAEWAERSKSEVGIAKSISAFGFMVGGSDRASLAQGLTIYYNVYGSDDSATISQREIRVPFNCLISELRVDTNVSPGAGETVTFTLMVESLASTLTCQLGAADEEAQDLVNVVSVSEDDLIVMRVVTSAGANTVYPNWSFKVVPTGP